MSVCIQAERLLDEGYEVVGVDYYDVNLNYSRHERLEKHDEFHFHKIDLADAAALIDSLQRLSDLSRLLRLIRALENLWNGIRNIIRTVGF